MVFILWAETLGEGEVDGTIYQGRYSFTIPRPLLRILQSYNCDVNLDIQHSN